MASTPSPKSITISRSSYHLDFLRSQSPSYAAHALLRHLQPPFFSTHWIIPIPSECNKGRGTGTHAVEGANEVEDAAEGFGVNFKRRVDYNGTTPPHQYFPLGQLDGERLGLHKLRLPVQQW